MTTVQQDAEFLESVIESTLLERALDWIAGALSPEDVFPESDLRDWADNFGYELREGGE